MPGKPPQVEPQAAAQFWACDLRDGRTVPPGLLNDARNVRYPDGLPETRKGVDKPAWANRVTVGADVVSPYGPPYGAGVFKNPDGAIEWQFIAADGYVWRTRPYNQSVSVPLPTGVKILSRCTFVQAFNQLFLFRGRYLKPLVLRTLNDGFEDLIPVWDSATNYAAAAEVYYGPFQAVTSITRSGDTAIVTTPAEHGYVTGADITLTGAVETAYNGRVNITVLDAFRFSYAVYGTPTTPATGTITCSDMTHAYAAGSGGNDPAAGESPDTHAAKWTRIYDIIPHADLALYTNNRLLIPTAYTPGTTGYNSTAVTYTKVDFLVATSILDEIHFDFADEFRINQGSSDEIMDLAKFTEDVVIVWKGSSWGVLSGVALDLTDLALDMRSQEYGLSARGAWCEKGKDIVFVADRRGFVSIQQSESGKLIGVDVPLSAPIQKLINRLDWTQRSTIRLTSWNSHFYAAVPLRLPLGADQNSLTVSGAGDGNGIYTRNHEFSFTDGDVYQISLAPDGRWHLYVDGSDSYSAATLEGTWRLEEGEGGPPVPTVTLGELPQYALLVFSNVSAARLGDPQQGWCPVDTGSALNVLEWFKLKLDGEERLFFLSTDGWVNLMEEHDRGDRVAGPDAQGLGWEEIETRARFTPQGNELAALLAPTGAQLALATWRPQYSLAAHFSGVNRTTTLCTDKTRSRTRYFRPWNRPAYDPTNVNLDHGDPDREDYSVVIGADGFTFDPGVVLDRMQEALHRFRLSGRQGRSVAIELINTQGRVRLHGLRQTARPGREREGLLT